MTSLYSLSNNWGLVEKLSKKVCCCFFVFWEKESPLIKYISRLFNKSQKWWRTKPMFSINYNWVISDGSHLKVISGHRGTQTKLQQISNLCVQRMCFFSTKGCNLGFTWQQPKKKNTWEKNPSKIIDKLHFVSKSVTSQGRVVKQNQVTFSQSTEQLVIICSVYSSLDQVSSSPTPQWSSCVRCSPCFAHSKRRPCGAPSRTDP